MHPCRQSIGCKVSVGLRRGGLVWPGVLWRQTCFTLTITKLSTSGYFSSGRWRVRPNLTNICCYKLFPAHRKIDNSSATSWRLLVKRCWFGWCWVRLGGREGCCCCWGCGFCAVFSSGSRPRSGDMDSRICSARIGDNNALQWSRGFGGTRGQVAVAVCRGVKAATVL